MAIKYARRVEDLHASSIFRINSRVQELQAKGRDIRRLDAGEPDFDTPEHIRAAGRHAIDQGYTRYTAIGGLDELKQAISKKFQRDNNLSYGEDEVMHGNGAKQCLFNLCMSVLHPGDEVVLIEPHWGSYPAMVKIAWATPVNVPTRIEDGFIPSPEALAQAMSDRTRLVIINSPNNPSGQIYSKQALQALGDVLKDYPDVFIATDDIYEHLRWNGGRYYNIVNACPWLKDRVVVINGVSKAYAMTGWRVGFCAGNAEVIGEMKKLQGQSTSHTAAMAQVAAAAALDGDQQCVTDMRDAFHRRHALVCKGLDALKNVDYLPAHGSFYCLPDFTKVIEKLDDVDNDQQLADWLLDNSGVAMVPGSAFGAPNHLRLSFAAADDDIEQALARLRDALG